MKGLSLFLFVSILAVGSVFGRELPPDWKDKLEAASEEAARRAWINCGFHYMATPEAVRGQEKTNIMNEIKLGDRVRSSVSGFEGTVTAICTYLHGDTRYSVTAPIPYEGEEKREWFGASELEPVE